VTLGGQAARHPTPSPLHRSFIKEKNIYIYSCLFKKWKKIKNLKKKQTAQLPILLK
jgi:hypothetical protein